MWIQRKGLVQKENGQTQVTLGTLPGIIPIGKAKTYGLEVDSWSAVEPVPYLCAVNLNSSCEDLFEGISLT